MSETIHVEVTQEDINYGVPFRSTKCPLARAIRRAVGSGAVSVGTDYFRFDGKCHDYSVEIPLPDAAIRFRWRFDSSDRPNLSPIAFDLEIPS